VAVAGTAIAAARTLLETLVTGDTELTTAITGADASPAETAVLEAWFGERFPGVDLEVHVGGQPLYPYLFGVE
jgi:hypothetical protein